MSDQDKQAARDAIDRYVEKFGAEIPLVDLRGFVRSETGKDFAGPTLASFLKAKGFVRDGVRPFDGCPGRSTFYVRPAS